MQASGRTATAPRQAALPQVSRGKVFQTCATVGQQTRDQFALLQGACVQWSGVCQLHCICPTHPLLLQISGAMLGGGLLLRQAAPYTSAALGADAAALQALLAGDRRTGPRMWLGFCRHVLCLHAAHWDRLPLASVQHGTNLLRVLQVPSC